MSDQESPNPIIEVDNNPPALEAINIPPAAPAAASPSPAPVAPPTNPNLVDVLNLIMEQQRQSMAAFSALVATMNSPTVPVAAPTLGPLPGSQQPPLTPVQQPTLATNSPVSIQSLPLPANPQTSNIHSPSLSPAPTPVHPPLTDEMDAIDFLAAAPFSLPHPIIDALKVCVTLNNIDDIFVNVPRVHILSIIQHLRSDDLTYHRFLLHLATLLAFSNFVKFDNPQPPITFSTFDATDFAFYRDQCLTTFLPMVSDHLKTHLRLHYPSPSPSVRPIQPV